MMNFRKYMAMVCILNLVAPPAQALTVQQVEQEVTTQLANDSTLLSGWMTSNLKYVIPFNSTSGNVDPRQLKLFGFEAGVEGVVSGTKMDVDALHSLPTTLVDTKSIDMFSRLPFPMVLAHAKIGLPFGLDGGIRIGGIPKTTSNSGSRTSSIENKVIGFDVRKKIIEEGVAKPFGLTVGVNYTHADGFLDLNNTYNSLTYTDGSGNQAKINNGLTNEHAQWKTNSYGVQAILDKSILFITPYIGASINRNSGNISNAITTTGTPTVTPSGGAPTNTGDLLTATGSSTDTANKWDTRALLGLEFTFLPFMKLGIGGEYAGSKNVAGSIGLRIQFR
jgi:hypothetical protein